MARPPKFRFAARHTVLVCAASLLYALLIPCRVAAHDNPPGGDIVGAIEGDSISVHGPMSVETSNGDIKTILRSGSDVQVKSGQAHIDLPEGGNITICGAAHFSVLKSSGALTIALDNGVIHAHIEGPLALTVYTAQIQARPIAIGNGPQDILVRFDIAGAMCIRASKGAVRIEHQLSGQTLVIPQNAEISLTNGQLETMRNSAGQCACELQLTEKPSTISTQINGLASTEELRRKTAEPKLAPPVQTAPQPPQPKEEPIYQVFMPPLHYDANAKVQQDYDPNLIVVVRRARVRPTLIFQGKVEGDPVIAQASSPARNGQKSGGAKKAPEPSAWDRVRNFFHNLWSPSS